MKVCVRSDSELKELDASQYLDDYSWDIFISEGHAGFLGRNFRADLIRNKAGMPTANT